MNEPPPIRPYSSAGPVHPLGSAPVARALSQQLGLHPLVGFGVFAIDWMLFGSELFSAGAVLPFSIAFGLLLTIPAALLQRYSHGDGWGAAWGKALLVGILTAIPTALPSLLPASLGIVGLFGRSSTPRQLTDKRDE